MWGNLIRKGKNTIGTNNIYDLRRDTTCFIIVVGELFTWKLSEKKRRQDISII